MDSQLRHPSAPDVIDYAGAQNKFLVLPADVSTDNQTLCDHQQNFLAHLVLPASLSAYSPGPRWNGGLGGRDSGRAISFAGPGSAGFDAN